MDTINFPPILTLAELNEHFELNQPFSGIWKNSNLCLEVCEHEHENDPRHDNGLGQNDPYLEYLPTDVDILPIPDDFVFDFDTVFQNPPQNESFDYSSPSVYVEELKTQMDLTAPFDLLESATKKHKWDFLNELLLGRMAKAIETAEKEQVVVEEEEEEQKVQLPTDTNNVRLGVLSPLSRESSGFPGKKPTLRRGSHGLNSKGNLYFPSISGIVSLVENCPNLVNYAVMELSCPVEEVNKNKTVELLWNDDHKITCINRTRYIRRNLDILQSTTVNTVFKENPQFDTKAPYEPQYISYQVDPVTKMPMNETRCGLCPYCPEINFRNFKTSTYSQHLALWHGVHTDNYLTPNPTHYGVYKICKNQNKNRRTKPHIAVKNGVVCPVCFDVIETESSKTTKDKPLSGYLRHFRDNHRKSMYKGTDLMKFFNKTEGF